MLIDLKMVFTDLKTIEMAIFMTLTVILCKGGAAWLMRTIFGYGASDVVVAWGMSLPQAATTLAVVLVGYELKLFDDAILNATIVMVLITCVLGPLLVEFAGRKIVAAEADNETESTDDDDRFQRILIPLANPASSENLLDLAINMRRNLSDEPLLPLSVARDESQVANNERLLSTSVLHLAGAEVPVKPLIRVDSNPIQGILRAQSESRASSMVMGWAGPETNWQRHFHLNRGVIDEIISKTTCQLTIVRLTQPVAVIQKVVLVISPLAHAEPRFDELIADYKMVTKRIQASMVVISPQELKPEVQQRIRSIGSKCSLDFADSENDLAELVDQHVDSTSLLVVSGCREGTISWDASWQRQMTRLAHHHRSISFAVATRA